MSETIHDTINYYENLTAEKYEIGDLNKVELKIINHVSKLDDLYMIGDTLREELSELGLTKEEYSDAMPDLLEKKILKIEIRKIPSLENLGLVRLHPTKQHPDLFPPIECVVIALAEEYAEKWNFEKFIETKEDLKCTSCEEYGILDIPVWSEKDEEMFYEALDDQEYILRKNCDACWNSMMEYS